MKHLTTNSKKIMRVLITLIQTVDKLLLFGEIQWVVVLFLSKIGKLTLKKRKATYSYAIIAFHLANFLKFIQAKRSNNPCVTRLSPLYLVNRKPKFSLPSAKHLSIVSFLWAYISLEPIVYLVSTASSK